MVALLGLLACGIHSAANAGLINYTAGTGGTFDPSTPSTFTLTNFGAGSLTSSVNYTDVKVFAKWNGTGPYPGAFTITSFALSSPSTSPALGNVSFLSNTGSNALVGNAYVTLNSAVNTTNLSGVQLTLTIPTLTVSDGWTLDFLLSFTDNGLNTNATAYQAVSALNSGSNVPEIDPAAGGSALSLVTGVLAMIEQRRRRAAPGA